MSAKILVTGGTGYIGSHTTIELIKSGFEVIIIDNLSNSSTEVLDGIEKITGVRPDFVKLDICEVEALKSFFKQYTDIQAVIHFAALKAVGESVAKPLAYYKNNLLSLANLMEEMLENKIPNLVFSSSCTVYSEPDTLPITEQSPLKKSKSPYGRTKQISEEIIEDTIKANPSLKAICLRYFNPVGAHESGLIGELPLGTPNNLMPFITQTAIGIYPKLRVFGSDYNTPDGTNVRDYIHVVDLAQAHVIATQRLIAEKNKAAVEFFNLGTGNGISVLEVIKSFEKVSGLKLNYEIVERRPGDVEQIYADTTFANQELGWKTEKTLDEMTHSAWIWEQNYRKKKI